MGHLDPGEGVVIQILSFWRNDAGAQLEARAFHLLAKTATQEVCWLWGVGDSTDNTRAMLDIIADMHQDVVQVADITTGIEGPDVAARRRRGSVGASKLFHMIDPAADFAMVHESDLRTDPDIAEQLLLAGDGVPMAGWPTITLDATLRFYDIWAYRDMSGACFLPTQPYSPQWSRGGPFQVTSFGSVWIVPADMLRDRTIDVDAVVELCGQWIAEGHTLWCDPRIEVVQPASLWEAQ